MDQRPDPMVPAEVDLRGLKYMPLLGARLFESDFYLDADDAEFRIGLRLWWAAWNQVPAGSLPSEDNRLRKLAGLDEAAAKWRRVRARALHGFVECADGRLYHPVIAEQALIAWDKRAEDIEERENEAERQRRSRAERKRLFTDLRGAGVTPKYDIPMAELRKLHAQHIPASVTQTVTPPVTVTGASHVTPPVTVTDTAKTGRDGTGIEEIPERPAHGSTAAAPGEVDGSPAPGSRPAVGQALRRAGVDLTRCSLPDPRLDELLRTGSTLAELEAVAREAVAKGVAKPVPWIVATMTGRRREAAATPRKPAGRTAATTVDTATRDAEARRLLGFAAPPPASPAPPTQEAIDG